MPADQFQVKLAGKWADYKKDEDKILKRAYLAGFPNAKYQLRKQRYQVDFKNMMQRNLNTGKVREIRAPHKWKAPAKPIVEAGPTFCIKVPAGSPGTCIQVPDPRKKGCVIAVNVPAAAKVGAAMLVPIPKAAPVGLVAPAAVPAAPAALAAPAVAPAAPSGATCEAAAAAASAQKGWGTGAKVVAGGAAAAVVFGGAVGGAILGDHIAEEGWDATMADLGEALGDAGEAIAEAAEDVGEAVVDAAEDAHEWLVGAAADSGDFIMDLF